MNIVERMTNDITVLELSGNFTREGNTEFKKHVTTTIDAGARKLILNLERVPYMDSSGLGELVSCYTALQSVKGHLKLLHLTPRLQALLTITKLNTVFEAFDSEAAAVSSFSAEGI
jgi:anti-sigma B factor antagonist